MIRGSGIRIGLRPHTDDLKTVKSNFVTEHSESSIDIPARLEEIGFEVRAEHHGGYVYARRISK